MAPVKYDERDAAVIGCVLSIRYEPMKDERTLCWRCEKDYRDAGYRLRHIWSQAKEPCDICGRPAWRFEIVEVKRDKYKTP